MPPQSSDSPLVDFVLPLKKCPFFKKLLFFYWETQQKATRENETLRDLVNFALLARFCPPSGHFLKEALLLPILLISLLTIPIRALLYTSKFFLQ